MAQTYLVVPMDLDALVVNQGVLNRDTFRWWQFNYQSLNQFKSPEPTALDASTGTPRLGIYLHWTLPNALRHGNKNKQTGDMEYPLVPNRWLILRFGNGASERVITRGWVIESDCPKTSQNIDTSLTSMYLLNPAILQAWKNSSDTLRNSFVPTGKTNQPQIANIGIPFPLSQGWNERAADTMFLTAIAPGNHVFTIYTQHNPGVFSFYDDLHGIDNDLVGYLVAGWYSNPQKDIMAPWQQDVSSTTPYDDLLKNLGWTVSGSSQTQANATLYEGMAFSIGWQRTGNAPGTPALGNPPVQTDPLQAIGDSGLLNVSIGNTTIDAFCALMAPQFKAKGYDISTIKLLEAFQYDQLAVVNQVNGDALLEEKIRQAWYGSKPGGYSWTIVEDESDGSSATVLTEAEATWLLQLNNDQTSLDKALEELYDLQWNLNATWYRAGFLADYTETHPKPPAGITNLADYLNQLAAQLDPAQSDSLAKQVMAQITKVQGLMSKVPQPNRDSATNSQDAFINGISAFAKQKGLASSKTLKALPKPRYWKANNPVIMISGVEPAMAIDPKATLPVRLTSDLVTGFTVSAKPVNQSTAGAAVPTTANLSNLPAPVPSLIQEYFFLDPAGANSIASLIDLPVDQVTPVMTTHDPATYQGTLPGVNLDLWRQPWSPMYVEWQVSYTFIPELTNNNPSWTFDGTDYHFTPGTGSPVLGVPLDVRGVSLLSPHSQFLFGSRLKDFINKYGSEADLQKLFDWITQIDQWKFLSQELTGFNEQLALRDGRAFRSPSPQDVVGAGANQHPIGELIGYVGITPTGQYVLPDSYSGQVNSVPYFPIRPIPFHGVRQGQAYFQSLNVYDKFGRILHVIESGSHTGLHDAKNFPLIRDDALNVDTQLKLTPYTDVAAVAQLPPRALQFARLDFDLIDGKNDTQMFGLDADVNPIAGWVLPNHLDHSILLYAPDGASLGEFRLLETEKGIRTGQWQAPPHSNIKTLDDVAAVAPHLAQMLNAPQIQDENSFQAFLDVIDATLWTIDPLGNRADQNLSVLIGRPLALVRARLQLSLDGPPIKDTGWSVALQPPDPDFLNYNYAIRLGDQATRQDGVIGYFTGDNYRVFNSVAATQTILSQGYVQQIGPLGTGGNYIPLQFNPASNAYVSILVDPRASIHATTGILPIKQLDIPPGFVDAPLSKIEVSFRIGPLLTAIQRTPSEGGQPPQYPNAISYLFPAEQNGQWSWWEDSGADWNAYTLLKTTPNAQLKGLPETLRDGILQLVSNLSKQT